MAEIAAATAVDDRVEAQPAPPATSPAEAQPIETRPCEACGRAVATTARFCPGCGHRIGTAVESPEPGPAPVAEPVPLVAPPPAAAVQRAPEPPARLPVRPVALVATAVAIFLFGIGLGAILFGPEPQAAAQSSAGAPVASPTPRTRPFSINVVIDATLGEGADPWADVQIGAPCVPRGDAFPDIVEGASVVVADQTGTILAKETLPEGRKSGTGTCTYRTTTTVPDARFYRVGIADRMAEVFPFDDLSNAGWATDITFVVAP